MAILIRKERKLTNKTARQGLGVSLATGDVAADPVVTFRPAVRVSFDALSSLAGRLMKVTPIATAIAAE
jgi:hypothetical protein